MSSLVRLCNLNNRKHEGIYDRPEQGRDVSVTLLIYCVRENLQTAESKSIKAAAALAAEIANPLSGLPAFPGVQAVMKVTIRSLAAGR